jgi:hypothetical protein
MELSPEEKAKQEREQRVKMTRFPWKPVLLIFVVTWGLMWTFSGLFTTKDGTEKPSEKKAFYDLRATVDFNGTQFLVTNNDDFDWTDVKLEVNSGLIRSGYVFKLSWMNAGATYTIVAMRFAKSDGTRFNSFTTKPQKFTILCDTPKGKGFWGGNWE